MKGLRTLAGAIRAVASATALELASRPETLLLLLAGVVLTALIPLLHFHDFGEPGRIARDGGLAYQLVIGTALAAFSVSRSIRDELDDGTAMAALSKPVGRGAFLVGKWLGVCAVMGRFWAATLAATIIAARVSPRFVTFADGTMGYLADAASQSMLLAAPPLALLVGGALHNRRRARFCLAASAALTWLMLAALAATLLFDREWIFSPSFANAPLNVVTASLPILFATVAVSAFAAALATRLKAAAVAAVCAALVAAGLSWDAVTAAHPAMRLLPVANVQSLWLADSIAGGECVPLPYLAVALLYAASLSSFAILLGAAALKGRDL